MFRIFISISLVFLAACQGQSTRQPIIDMHRHAPLITKTPPTYDVQSQIAQFDEYDIVLAMVSMTSEEQIDEWMSYAPDRIIPAVMMPCPKNLAEPEYYCFPETDGLPDLLWLEDAARSGEVKALHELMFNYHGSPPSSEQMRPYWSLAAEYDLVVGVHSWSGPPPGASIRRDPNCCPNYDEEMGNPKNLRPVLERHPNLRIWLQHVGSDGDRYPELWTETLSLLEDYPNVYLDISITNSVLPIELHEAAITRLVNAGFGNRIMFGSDNIPIGKILERMNAIAALSEEQKRDILYNNAADFLRISPAERRSHHKPLPN